MTQHFFRTVLTATAVASLLSLSVGPAAGQTAKKAPATGSMPRTADGHPDLSGIWQGGGVSLFGETGEAVPSAAGVKNAAPPPRRPPPPYQEWAAAKAKQLAADPANAPGAQCMLLGVPSTTTSPMPLEIVQTPKKTYIMYEVMHTFRIIPTDGRPHPRDLDPTFMGDSIGRWDGDTFVVDAIGFNDKTWLDGNGHFHSESLHLTERYTRTPQDTLHYEVTAEDPKVMTGPWKVVDMQLRHPPRDERLMEYVCEENNVDVPFLSKPGGAK